MALPVVNAVVSTQRDGVPNLSTIPVYRRMPSVHFTPEGEITMWAYKVALTTGAVPTDIQEGDMLAEPGRAYGMVLLRFDYDDLGEMELLVKRAAGPA